MYCTKCGNIIQDRSRICPFCGETSTALLSSHPPLPTATPITGLVLAIIGVLCDFTCLFTYTRPDNPTLSVIFAIIGMLTGLDALVYILFFIDKHRLSGFGIAALFLSIAAFGFGVYLLITEILVAAFFSAFLPG